MTDKKLKETAFFVECPRCKKVRELPHKDAKNLVTMLCKVCRRMTGHFR